MKKSKSKLKNAITNREYVVALKTSTAYCIICNRRAGIFHAYCGPISNKRIKTWKNFRKTKWK